MQSPGSQPASPHVYASGHLRHIFLLPSRGHSPRQILFWGCRQGGEYPFPGGGRPFQNKRSGYWLGLWKSKEPLSSGLGRAGLWPWTTENRLSGLGTTAQNNAWSLVRSWDHGGATRPQGKACLESCGFFLGEKQSRVVLKAGFAHQAWPWSGTASEDSCQHQGRQ